MEDAKTIETFLAIQNEYEVQKNNEQKMAELEAKAKELLGKT